MNKSAFLQLIQQAATISDQQTEELEKVAATFPYCQTAHLLLAKSAYDKGSMLSTQRLRRASAYATNRQLLKRIIYTSPVAEPVFDEASVEEKNATAQPIAPAPLTASPEVEQDKTPVLEEFIAEEDTGPVASIATADDQIETAEAVSAEQNIAEEQQSIPPADVEETTLDEGAAERTVSDLPAGNMLEQPMEKLNSELALLLTIKSLSPSFTDLLAQKPDVDPQAPEAPTPPLALPAKQEPEVYQPEEDLASIIAAEAAAAAHLYYSTEEAEEAAAHTSIEEATAPEETEVKYAFDAIEDMYRQDVLGYWMASSRMGEALQLKEENELTRPKPAGFHPELILEYSKTHDLVQQEDTAGPALHGQQDIIDQFLKINPRLKTLNNIRLKPEPQEDLSLKSSKIKRGMASESLANIFLQQGKVKKAIKIYEQLILKSPEKKSYFAEQIEKLQNLS
ncbi:hypothetical protein [Pontibacter flavimaris]|uniref:Uncharacterized protein n=1 Tax=Pontibacter flavimaris TaxID=1797110 RepID=A0A1Q5PGU2_9BACT|nr:hypothetical protein [Pontibacter flavimaris]OKL41448.1 hypothetical protein A3841_10370 [Pontibacter flavimaris]